MPDRPVDIPRLGDDPAAWCRLVDAVQPASLLVVIESRMGPLLRSRLSAEDVLQEALLHAWRDRQGYRRDGVKGFRAWLLQIIDHRIHDAADREGALKRGGGSPDAALSSRVDGSIPAAVIQSTTPSRLNVHREQAEAMAAALAALPEDVRDVVRLRLFEQVPVEQIAQRLGIGHAAVRHRFRRGSALYRHALIAGMASRSRVGA